MKRSKAWMTTILVGAMLIAAPVFAAPRGGGSFSRAGSAQRSTPGAQRSTPGAQRSTAGAQRSTAGAQRFSGRSFNAPSGGSFDGRRDFDRGDDHRRDVDHGYARGSVGIGVGAYPYSYADPYYAASPYYAPPVATPACGYYDAGGNWIPDPYCQVPPVAPQAPYGY